MGSADLPEPAATCQQNLYTCCNSAPYSCVHHANARTMGICGATVTHGVNVLQRHTKP
jgi:hypothetical protein